MRSTAYTQTLHRPSSLKTRHSPSTRSRPSSTCASGVAASNTLSGGKATTNRTTSGSRGPRRYATLTSLLRNFTSANPMLPKPSAPRSLPRSTGSCTRTSRKLCTRATVGPLASTLAAWLVGTPSPRKGIMCWKQGCTPNFRLSPTTGTCSGHALQTCVCFRTSRTSRTFFRLSRFRLRCRRIGSARSGSHSHGYPIIARTRSTELRRSSAASPYVLTIASSCSADSGLTQPPATAYASRMTHAVSSSMYLNAPGLASCSSVRPLGHWDR
jgi:hypothetical protein